MTFLINMYNNKFISLHQKFFMPDTLNIFLICELNVLHPAWIYSASIWFIHRKIYYIIPLSLIVSCQLSLVTVGLKISSLPTSASKYHNKMFTWYFENWSNTRSSSSQKLSFVPTYLSSDGECTFITTVSNKRPLSTTDRF